MLLFSDDAGTIVYVGKAKNLRKRVSSYFSRHDLDPKTGSSSMIAGLDFIVTDRVEAFILENTLIKKHQPNYNIDLKDSSLTPTSTSPMRSTPGSTSPGAGRGRRLRAVRLGGSATTSSAS